MKTYPRRYRIASVLQEALAPLLTGVMREGMITIRHILLNKDCSVATVVYSIVGCDRVVAQTQLDKIAPTCRVRLAKRLNMRKTPALVFCYDEAGLEADKMRSFLEAIDGEEANAEANDD